jgi:hypothetical protein
MDFIHTKFINPILYDMGTIDGKKLRVDFFINMEDKASHRLFVLFRMNMPSSSIFPSTHNIFGDKNLKIKVNAFRHVQTRALRLNW